MVQQPTDEQIYQEYFEKLEIEFKEDKIKLQDLYKKYKDLKGNILHNIKENFPNSFVYKYTWTGCSQLLHNQSLFVKSMIETSKLCKESTSYLHQLIQG